ncbi:hypothetical protein L1049_019571 [Liquidambar formosana]|uniref:Membrane protein of ER body-like protein n=1 Tax=Liquidambar formosana TaxID=63359 RepID=A0AAP0X6L7_LIQFO
MEPDEQWEEDEVSLQGRRLRNRNNIATITSITTTSIAIITSNDSVPLKPARGTGSLNEVAAVDEELNDNSNKTTVVGVAGNGEGRLEKSVYFYKDEDSESANGFSGMLYTSTGCSNFEENPGDQDLDVAEKNFDIQKSLSAVIKLQYEENPKDERSYGLRLLPSEKSCEEENTSFRPCNSGSIEKADVILIKERDQEVSELDVERVLGKQDTHDLYCPNCNSCITRRVILRKRKRKIGNIQPKAKRDKFETRVDSELDPDHAYTANGKGHDTVDFCLDHNTTPAVSDYNREGEPDIFRCLSCFSFFIPTGNGSKLFRIFGDRNENEGMQNPRQVSTTNTNWLFSIFASEKGKMTFEQGGAAQDHSEVDIIKQSHSSCFLDNMLPWNESDHPVTPLPGVTLVNTREPAKDAILKTQKHGMDFLVSSTAGSLMLEESQIDRKYSMEIGNETLPDQSGHGLSMQGPSSLIQSICVEELVYDSTTQPKGDGKKIVASTRGPMLVEKVMTDLGERSGDAVEKNNIGGAAQDDSEVDAILYQINEGDTVEHLNSSCLSDHMLSHLESDYPVTQLAGKTLVNTKEPVEDSTLKPQQGGLKILMPPTAVSLMLKKSKIDLNQRSDVEIRNDTLPDQNGHALSIQGPSLPVQSFCAGGLVNEVTTQTWEAGEDILVSSTKGSILLEKVMNNVGEKSDDAVQKNNAGDDVILTVEARAVQAASQMEQSIIVSGETGILPLTQIIEGEQKGAEARDVQGWDILKSIVYGGLIESITSPGVVSSAAGADAATLNVLALALANVIGGVFIIGHDLKELKNDHSGRASNQSNQQVDRYQELLGWRENFILHATVAVLSFLLFGLVPPVIYAFSFRRSDSREFKLAAVMAASLLCIILLALGKGHIQRPPKSYIKNVLYYVSIGLMAAGVSYIVGSLIKELLEKFGWFESGSDVAMPFPESGPVKPAWASY